MRPGWREYFLEIASVVAKRGTCDRKQVGAVITDANNRIVSTGYNGVPAGMPHCDDNGHVLVSIDGRESCIATLHAESNAIDQAGERARGGIIYVTVTPCYECAKRIIGAGIVECYFSTHYQSRNTGLVRELFHTGRVRVVHYQNGEQGVI